MRKRVLLIVAPLCVVAIAAGVAVAAPSDAEHRGAKLDKLHAERPDAASVSLNEGAITATHAVTVLHDYLVSVTLHDYLVSVTLHDYLNSVALQDFLAAVQAEEAARSAAAAAGPRASGSVYSNSHPGDFLACVRQRESGGNYSVYNSGGSGAAGAYQFMPGTWNSIAASSGRGDLVGVDPAQAAPADQDAMAQALYSQQGSAPWGGAC